MAKTTAPLLSLGATGTIAKTAVFSKWRGIPYVRQHVIPANPNTAGQQATRNVFRTMSEMWKVAPTLAVTPWDAFATGRPFVGRNAFMGQNVEAMRGEVDMDLAVGSPGARGGLPPTLMVIDVTVAFTIGVDLTIPALPTGWTISLGVASAWPDQDPAITFVGPVSVDSDADPTLISITVPATGLHQIRGWLEWNKPDGSLAYSVALAATATVI